MMAAGVFGLTPLTGVVTPFLSYGGSAMVANLAALGVLDVDQRSTCTGGATARHFAGRFDGSAGSLAAAAAVVVIAVDDAGRGRRGRRRG